MNNKVTIKNISNEVLQFAIFTDAQTQNDWLDILAQSSVFGKAAYEETIFDVDGKTIIEVIQHPSEYLVEIEDITAQVEQENLMKQYPAISPRQIRLALLALGITEANIDGMISTLSSPSKEAAMIAWKYSTEFQRFAPMVESIGLMVGLTQENLNTLWKSAILL